MFDDLVIESVSSRVYIERCPMLSPRLLAFCALPPLLAELSIYVTERLSNDGVRSLLAQLRLQNFYERNQNASLNLCLFDRRNAHTSPLCGIASTGN